MRTADGEKPISEIQVGEAVLAYHEGLRATGVYTVTDTFAHLDPVIIELTLDDEQIATTPEHPFYVLLRGWVNAGDLQPGMAVRQADGSYGLVEDVAVERRAQAMYNLTVAEAHTFFVGEDGWLVHNANCLVFPEDYAPTPLGRDLADQAEMYYMALSERQMRNTTVAVAKFDTRYYVTTNGGAPTGAISKIQKLVNELRSMGADVEFVEHNLLSRVQNVHAEKHLYNTFRGNEMALDTIGVSHYTGPCPSCRAFFGDTDILLHWNDNWKEGLIP